MIETILDKINSLAFVGLGYVIKPSDLDIDEYLNHCFVNKTISILPDTSGMAVHNVPIPNYLLQLIKFPKEKETFGSFVVYILHPTQKRPIVVAVLDKIGQDEALDYHEFKFTTSHNNNSVNIIGKSDKGNLVISVESEEEDGGNIDIIINHLNEKGKFTLEVKGDVEIISKNIAFNVEEEIYFKSKTYKIENDKTQIISDAIEIGSKDLQKATKGESLNNDILSPLLDIISSLTVVVTGTSGVINPTIVPQINQLKTKLQSVLSKKVKIE